MDGIIVSGLTHRATGRGYLSADHISTATGLDPAFTISKNGGNFANPAAGASVMTEIEATGWYYFALAAGDADTVGPLICRGTHATMDNIEVVFQVVSATRGLTGTAVPAVAGGGVGGIVLGSAANNLAVDAAGKVAVASIQAGAIENATFAADVGSTAAATNIISQAVELVIKANNLDHLIKTAKDTNWATTVTKESIIDLMTSKDASQTFARVTDALEAIRDAMTASAPQAHSATANTETTGSLISGTFADTTTNDNTTYYITAPVAPAVGGFGLNVVLTTGIGTGRVATSLTVNGNFAAGGVRAVNVWAYDYIIAAYVQLSNSVDDFGNSASETTETYTLTRDMRKVSDGEVKIRFTSTSITTTDRLNIDFFQVTSVAEEAAGLTSDVIQHAVWARADSGHDEDTLGYNLSKMFLRKGHPVAATSASQFTVDTGSTVNDAYNGMLIMLEDKTDDHYETRRIVDYIGGTKEIFLDAALTFTPAAADDFYIFSGGYANVNVTHIGGTAQTAGDIVAVANLIEDIARNRIDITNATGAVSLKNDAGVEMLTGSVTDDSTTTTRTRLV